MPKKKTFKKYIKTAFRPKDIFKKKGVLMELKTLRRDGISTFYKLNKDFNRIKAEGHNTDGSTAYILLIADIESCERIWEKNKEKEILRFVKE